MLLEDASSEDNFTVDAMSTSQHRLLEINNLNANTSTSTSINTNTNNANTSSMSISTTVQDSFEETDGEDLQTTIIASSLQLEKAERMDKQLTSNKLKFHRVGLHGRKKEKVILQQCLQRATMDSSTNSKSKNYKSTQKAQSPLRTVSSSNSLAGPSKLSLLSPTIPECPDENDSSDDDDDDDANKFNNRNGNGRKTSSETTPPSSQTDSDVEPIKIYESGREVVWIGGLSGTGKTALAMSIKGTIQRINKRKRGIFVFGKYSLNTANHRSGDQQQPYYGIASACQEICREILSLVKASKDQAPKEQSKEEEQQPKDVSREVSENAEIFQEIRKRLIAGLGTTGLKLLAGIVPGVQEIVDDPTASKTSAATQTLVQSMKHQSSQSSLLSQNSQNKQKNKMPVTSSSSDGKSEDAKLRVQYAFRCFVRIVTTKFKPLVIVLDDLQWADLASFELIETIIADIENSNLLMIGLYRSDEILQQQKSTNQNKPTPYQIDENTTSEETKNNGGKDEGLLSTSYKVHPFQKLMDNLNEKRKDYEFNISRIEIGNLTLEETNSVIMDVLGMEIYDGNTKTLPLAELCFRRTLGNAFFLKNYLSMLKAENLLVFNLMLFQWEWNIEDIQKTTSATSNVIDLMKKRIQNSLSKPVQQLLFVAACLGHNSFRSRWIEVIFKYLQDQKEEEASSALAFFDESGGANDAENVSEFVNRGLEKASEEGILERRGDRDQLQSFQWVHDKVQEAVLQLMEDTSANKKDLLALKLSIGKSLCNSLTGDDLEDAIFIIVNLLNNNRHGSNLDSSEYPYDDESSALSFRARNAKETNQDDKENIDDLADRIKLAELNLQATRKAASISAMSSAARYAKIGITLLPSEDLRWGEHYELSLELFTFAAECTVHSKDVGSTEFYCEEVLRQKNRPILDKLRAYEILGKIRGRLVSHNAAIAIYLDVLNQLGISFPQRPIPRLFSMGKNFFRMKAKVLKMTPEEISRMPILEDEIKIKQMYFLLVLSAFSATQGESSLVGLTVFRGIDCALKHGICDHTVNLFMMFAVLMVMVGDIDSAAKIAKTSFAMQERMTSKAMIPVLYLAGYFWIECRVSPLQNLYKPMMYAYQTGLPLGDSSSSMWCIFVYIVFGLHAGRSLNWLESDCSTYTKQMHEMNNLFAELATRILWQMVLNLIGNDEANLDHPYRLEGKAIPDVDRVLNFHEIMLGLIYKTMQCRMCCIFAEYEKGAEIAIENGDKMAAASPAYYLLDGDAFCASICLFATAGSIKAENRNTGKLRRKRKTYIQRGKVLRSRLHKWSKNGNPNVKHFETIVDAEFAAVKGKRALAKALYKNGITIAARSGFVNDAGLASERFADFLLQEEMPDLREVMHRLDEAIRYYSEWGAFHKVGLLKAKCDGLYKHRY